MTYTDYALRTINKIFKNCCVPYFILIHNRMIIAIKKHRPGSSCDKNISGAINSAHTPSESFKNFKIQKDYCAEYLANEEGKN